MSCFIMEAKTINRIVTYLATDNNSPITRKRLDTLGFTDNGLLAQTMLDLNTDAYYERYNERHNLVQDYHWERASIYQIFKSLRCWLYQCSEGNIPETSELFKIMDDYSVALAFEIIETLPEYAEAKWK